MFTGRTDPQTTGTGFRLDAQVKMRWWTRRMWMRLAAINALTSVVALIGVRSDNPVQFENLQLAAQLQFMHSMATIACATFMNTGAQRARFAPPFFLAGSSAYSILTLVNQQTSATIAYGQSFAIAGMIAGWLILVLAGRDVDRDQAGIR